jgi:hypothetical protein
VPRFSEAPHAAPTSASAINVADRITVSTWAVPSRVRVLARKGATSGDCKTHARVRQAGPRRAKSGRPDPL